MSSLELSYSLSVGSNLVREPDLDAAIARHRPVDTGNEIYGALVLTYDGVIALDERYWDRLDLLLSRMFSSIRAVQAGELQTFELEDTHVECAVSLLPNDVVRVTIDEHLVFDATRQKWLHELRTCTQRLCQVLLRHDLPIPPLLRVIVSAEDPS